MKPKYEQKKAYTITDLETLKVISDPLRYQLLEILTADPQTVKQMAEKLGLQPVKLYYHINLLEKHNLIYVVETRQLGNLLEKYYQAVAKDFDVDRDLLSFVTTEGRKNIEDLLSVTIDATREEVLRSLEARSVQLERGAEEKPRQFMLTRLSARLREDRAAEFQERVKDLLQEFKEADCEPSEEPLQTFSFMVALYPTFYYPEEAENGGQE